MREAGILLPISSLPNQYGIGTLGRTAYQFVDFLKRCKQTYWQVLPIGPTSFGDSPYQSLSTFAGNPYFIDFDILKSHGLLQENEYSFLSTNERLINYENLYYQRYKVLRKAYTRFDQTSEKYLNFLSLNLWVQDYSLFMSIKNNHEGASWLEWPLELKTRDKPSLSNYIELNQDDINFYKFLQYMFYEQWQSLKNYANSQGIKIIGDLPIYVAMDSCDVWANPKQFMLNSDYEPIEIAGVPPDAFSEDGQLWGNPLYNYNYMAKTNYKWWINRFGHALNIYDIVRLDHFRGFEAYWAIPNHDINAKRGVWRKGPGIKFFNKVKKALNIQNDDFRVIAEDLGFLTNDVYTLLKETGFPGMKVLEFAFDPNGDSDYLPHNINYHSIIYPGTHDNMPLKAWYDELDYHTKKFVNEYLSISETDNPVIELLRATLGSASRLAIIQLQDYLELGKESRINTPSTMRNNWVWRFTLNEFSEELINKISYFTSLYRRVNKQ